MFIYGSKKKPLCSWCWYISASVGRAGRNYRKGKYNNLSLEAEANNFITISIETPEKRSLPALLIPNLRAALLKLDRLAAAGDSVKKALKAENDLMSLFVEIGTAAKEKKTALILFIDEIQYIEEEHFASLILALHRCTQKQLPVTIIGAGLPQLVGQAGRAKSYAERLFEFSEIGPLSKKASIDALVLPAKKENVEFEDRALEEILEKTKGYPYFLQE